jgi:WD40 repeat protein
MVRHDHARMGNQQSGLGTDVQVSPGFATMWEVAVSPAGDWLASCGTDGGTWLWEAATKRLIRRFLDHEGWVHAIAFSPNGTLLASGGEDGTIRVRDLTSGEVYALPAGNAHVRDVAFSRDGIYLAATGDDGMVRVWHVRSYDALSVIKASSRPLSSVAFGPNNRVTWSVEHDREPLREEQECPAIPHVNLLARSVFLTAELLVACGSRESARPGVWLWPTDGEVAPRALADPRMSVRSVVLSPDSTLVAGEAYDEGTDAWAVLVWDTRSGELRHRLTTAEWVRSVAFSPDGSALAAHGGQEILRWDTTTWRSLAGISRPATSWPVVGYAADGTLLAAGGGGGHLHILRGDRRSEVTQTGTDRTSTQPIAFNPRGTLMALGVLGAIQLWDLETGQLRHRLGGYRGQLGAVGFAPDGTVLAGGGSDRVIRLWNVDTGQEEQTLLGHTDMVLDVAFGPHGTFASAGGDGVRVWDRTEGTCRRHLVDGIPGARWLAVGLHRRELSDHRC